jgi:hypothetical protein
MLDSKFIDILSLSFQERQTLLNMELGVINFIKGLSPNKICFGEDRLTTNEDFGMNTHIQETLFYDTFGSNGDNEIGLYIVRLLQGNDYDNILETLKVISKVTIKKSTITSIISTTIISDLMLGLLKKLDIEINMCVLKILNNLLEHYDLNYFLLITPEMINIFNILLDINDNDMSLCVLKCLGVVVYRIVFLNLTPHHNPELQNICKRLSEMFNNKFWGLAWLLNSFADNMKIDVNDSICYISFFIFCFKYNIEIIIPCLEYFETLLKYELRGHIRSEIVFTISDLTYTKNPAFNLRNSETIIGSMRFWYSMDEWLTKSDTYRGLLFRLIKSDSREMVRNFAKTYYEVFGEFKGEEFFDVFSKVIIPNFREMMKIEGEEINMLCNQAFKSIYPKYDCCVENYDEFICLSKKQRIVEKPVEDKLITQFIIN